MTVTPTVSPLPHNVHTVIPFLVLDKAERFVDFATSTLKASLVEKDVGDEGRLNYALLQLGNAFVECGEASLDHPAMPAALHVYVDDVDEAVDAMGAAECVLLDKPSDKEYGERMAVVRDPWDNVWFVATYVEGREG